MTSRKNVNLPHKERERDCPVSEPPVLDPSVLQTLDRHMGNGRELSEKLIAVFRREYPGQVTEIHVAIASRELSRIQRAAHTFKGGSAALGLKRLEELCKKIEMSEEARMDEENEALQQLDERLDGECLEALRALEAFQRD